MATNLANPTRPPFMTLNVNADEILLEVVDILREVKDEIGIVTRAGE